MRRFAVIAMFGVIISSVVLAEDTSAPAVSGPNGKFSVEGGKYDDEASVLGLGSYTMPLSPSIGVQFDGAIGSIDEEFFGGGGLHLFTRDPESYLLGFFGSYHDWNDISIWRAAAEFEFYLDRFSITGLAGAEGVDVPTTKDGLLVLNKDDEHFFGYFEGAYYPLDDLKLSAGYRYENETSLGAASAEYLLRSTGSPISLFARGRFGDDDHTQITGGVKVYLGADNNKSLISRHRTEDPQNHTPVFPDIQTKTAGGPNFCPIRDLIHPDNACRCPEGTFFNEVQGPPCDTAFDTDTCFQCFPEGFE